ncbi:hypothetical protein FRC04_000904 [Tulasnella sp. 424]|nr:hypothetical protein FRC04_000904 [Tulasnella sp. 424]
MVHPSTDNNSGFTVIDVTDPDSPAYCFWGWSGDYGFSPGYPIAPKAYALRYYTEDEGERMFEDLDREVQNAIREIQNWRFIGRKDILSEAWESVESPMPAGIEEEPLSHGSEEFMKALRTVIGTGNAEDAQRMADKISTTHVVVESLRKTLRRETLPEHCNPILNKVFVITQELSRSDELDLSWMQLSPTQISQIVQAVVQTYSFKISGLDISGNDTITEETLSEIFKLEKAKDIKRVFLFGCSKVEDIRRADMPGTITELVCQALRGESVSYDRSPFAARKALQFKTKHPPLALFMPQRAAAIFTPNKYSARFPKYFEIIASHPQRSSAIFLSLS